MKPALRLARCPYCNGDHGAEHHAAVATLDEILWKLDQAEALRGTPEFDAAIEQSRFLLRRAVAELERRR